MKKLILLISAVVTLFATGCSDDDSGVKLSTVKATVEFPGEYAGLSKDSVEIVFKNIANGRVYTGKTDATGTLDLTLEEGVYDISASVEKKPEDNHGTVLSFQASVTGVSVIGEAWTRRIELQFTALNKEWLIREIYITGSKTPAGKNYLNDQYVVIYNNTDRVLYADGLSFCETYQMTATQQSVNWQQFLPERIAAQAIYTVPGTGTEHPVQPGKGVVLAGLGVNHTLEAYNLNSKADMSQADFEWYDGEKDTDVPEVPNLVKTFSSSATVWIMNSQGNKSYFVFKLDNGMNMKTFLDENYVETPNASGSKNLPAYAIPVKYIYDGVEVSAQTTLSEHALPASVDAGFTVGSGIGSGKVIRRKVTSWDGERAILTDTNNSVNDFETGKEPSPYAVPKN